MCESAVQVSDRFVSVQCNLHGIWWIYLLGQIVGAVLASVVNPPQFSISPSARLCMLLLCMLPSSMPAASIEPMAAPS